MRFDRASSVEDIVWRMRLSDAPRAADRALIQKQFNGNPPFDESTAEENNIQININDLSGPNLLSMARRQWNGAFLKPAKYFTCLADSGPAHKQDEWSVAFTKHANTLLKRQRSMVGQIRATGAQTMLTGVGPVNWRDRYSVIPTPIPMGSLMLPSETEIDDFDNSLSYFAVFREWTPEQLWDMTHGPKVDPGWNLKLVESQMNYLRDQIQKNANSMAYQFMPERIEELIKQDKGYLGSDAVPTCDVWDFYFREAEDGNGWYRRVMLDWNAGQDLTSYTKEGAARPESRNKVGENTDFLYSSGDRKYANSVSEIIHCQFGDCSAYAPFKYHSIRSLGWMLWGVCDLQNRLHCKFNEAVFEQLMWFFQTAGSQDLVRLKKANFEHMGIIPQGIKFLTAQERFTPDAPLIQMAFARNRQLMSDSSTTYTQEYDKGGGEARTATETMAIVNSTQALASGVLEMGYTYETFKYREMVRRLCIKDSKDKLAREFRLRCLRDGIPEYMLDVERWNVEPEQVVGGGNKTLQMAQVRFLNEIRRNLPPEGQRIVDHMSVEAATDQPKLAERIAPMGQDAPISTSTNNAQLATDRIMRGLEYQVPKDAIYEDYVAVWMKDMGQIIQKIMQRGSVATVEEINGLSALSQYIAEMLQVMETNEDDREKVRQYQDLFGQLTNHLKGLSQRLLESMKQQAADNGGQQGDPKDAAKVQAMLIQAQAKAGIAEQSAAARTRQKEEQFQNAEKRKDQQTAADIARKGVTTRHELMANRLKTLEELAAPEAAPAGEAE